MFQIIAHLPTGPEVLEETKSVADARSLQKAYQWEYGCPVVIERKREETEEDFYPL